MHHETWLVQTSREVLSGQLPLASWLSLGLHGSLVNYGSSELRDSGGQYLGQFTPQEQGLGAAVSARWGSLGLGLGGRYLRLALPNLDTGAMAGDLGLLWHATSSLRVASVVKAVPLAGGDWRTVGSGGLAMVGSAGAWRWAYSGTVRLDPQSASELDLGAELGLDKGLPVALRLGYSQQLPAFVPELATRFSGGLGVAFSQYHLDYAYIPWGSFGATHRVSLSYAQPWRAAQPGPEAMPAPQPTPMPAATPVAAPTPALQAPTARPSEAQFRVLSDAVVQARSLEAAGQDGQALVHYHQAVGADPQDLAAWKGMALLYTRAGQVEYAQRCWRQVLRLDPQDPVAQQALQGP
jgi:hypothetical protein